MSAQLQDIIQELDHLLEPERFQDYAPNGLQVPGAERITTVVTAVSANLELFQRAREQNAQLVLAHHGILWASVHTAPIDNALKRRLQLLFDADISLAAYHLPLDAHPELGNNALLARALGAEPVAPFALHRGQPIGFIARFPEPGIAAADLFTRIRETTSAKTASSPGAISLPSSPNPLIFDFGPATVRTLAIVSGAGAGFLEEAIAYRVDAFITGEPAERVMAQAHEASVHFIAAGHYATETFGVKALGEHLSERFDLRHIFIDVPNPV
jgi:dinuclear metal center YbgI/SA1388 family protein